MNEQPDNPRIEQRRGIHDLITTYALVMRIPAGQVQELEAFIEQHPDWYVVHRKAGVDKLFILSDLPPRELRQK